MEAVCRLCVNTMNCIPHAKIPLRAAADGAPRHRRRAVDGVWSIELVCRCDSLSAIRYGRVRALRDSSGLTVDFINEVDFPCYGNGDDCVDSMAVEVLRMVHAALEQNRVYRQAVPTLSVLTITSNVVYGKKTGATTDGRKQGQPLAPRAKTMHGRETNRAAARASSSWAGSCASRMPRPPPPAAAFTMSG